MLVIKNLHLMSPHQHFSNPTSFGAKRLGLSSINQISSIINGSISLKIVILFYKYEFGGVNLTLLYQYMFTSNNFMLLMKNHVLVVIVLVSSNLALWKTTSKAIVV